MIFYTTRFGDVDFPEEQVVHFLEGLLGFEKETRFAILPFTNEGECPLEWMQSIHTPELAFIVTDPKHFIPDYSIQLLDNELAEIGLEPEESFALRVIVTVPKNHIDMTANLVGPLAFNTKRMTAKQFVLTLPQYDTRHFLFSEEIRNSTQTVR